MVRSDIRARTSLPVVLTALVLAVLVFMFFYFKREFFVTRTELNEDVMVEKITNMGKLHLVKYNMKDVLEKKEIRSFLPDQRILFIAAGAVAGCIDLTKVHKEDVVTTGDSVTVFLPKPEICYTKLDHKRSRVYDVSGAWFPSDAQVMVEDIYKVAEQKILENAMDMGILKVTQDNALLIFKPMLENISGKKVGIRFR
ncbi:MAG TPA: DUF4230 domain-containing protein [Sphingobacteriaceae bacterium]